MNHYDLRQADPGSPEVNRLIEYHLDEMHRWSPPESVHAMPARRLREPDITFYGAWAGERLAAVGALKALGEQRGELKSMRAAPEYLGKGAGQAILRSLVAEAERRGYRWLGLETGRPAPFHAAQALYRKHGFIERGPFGDYREDPFSLFMERAL